MFDKDSYLSYEDCVENNFGKTILDCNRCYNLQNVSVWEMYVHASIVGLIMFISLLGNLLFITLLWKFKKLRHRTSIVSLSFLLANTCFICSYHLPVIATSFSREWLYDFVGCQVIGFLSTQFILARWLNMGVLALDRFCAVRFPFSYSKHSKYILTALLSSSWIIPALLSIVTVQGYAGVVFRPNVPSCLLYAPTVDKGLLYFSFVSTFSFIVGAIIPIVLYSWLLHKARRIRTSVFRVGRITRNNFTTSILEAEDMPDRFSSEQKAMLTFAIIFIAFCLTGVPSYLFQVIRWFNTDAWCGIPVGLHFRVVELYASATAIDPFSLMRSRDFRKRIRHLLCCHNNCGKYYVNRRSIHSMIPPERNFDAIRSVATKALNLVTLTTSKEALDEPSDLLHLRNRRASAPAILFDCEVHLKFSEPAANKLYHQGTEESQSCSDLASSPSMAEGFNVNGVQESSEFKTKILYSDVNNRDCMEVVIAFD